MHILHIIAVTATDEEEAISNAETAIEPYGNGEVWDWYAVGGRWDNHLDGKNVLCYEDNPELFLETVNSCVSWRNHEFKKCRNTITGRKVAEEDVPDTHMGIAVTDDKDIIAKRLSDQNQLSGERFRQALELDEIPSGFDYGMTAYHMLKFSDLLGHRYCFHSRFYDGEAGTADHMYLLDRIEEASSETNLEKLEREGGTLDEQWLVAIDLHS